MNKLNSNIHHRRSIRLKGYDYSRAGLYFVTICCHNRECLFGKIIGAKNILPDNETPIMKLNDAGKIADECWLEIPNHFPNAILHEHIVMPNHIHGIIELANNANVGVENFQPLQPNESQPNESQPNESQPNESQRNESQRNEFQKIIPRSIGSIVRGYKIGVTKWFRTNTDIETVWQRNYYEHIIRNQQSYHTISEYIINNPAIWGNDKFYT